MTLSNGTKISHYEITSQIGKGGMGEVYQAKDTKLGREVAIKVLPEEFAQDTDRVARFQREAKLLASLNHPNIAAIYGLEEADGTHFLVMELVEGQTLAERIKGGPVPVEESLKLALQIAEALEAAHEKSVIHRDLKPANIKVTPEGKVKVLDFGLAKAFAGEQADLNLSNSPTLSVAATQQNVILGTAAYMSPEQARGKEVDKRADIWALGVVLFEMLTGRQVFSENTVSDTLASVLKTEPKWDSLPPNLHPRIRLMLERCLEKDPKKRYSGISDAWVDIDTTLTDPSGLFPQPVTVTASQARSQTLLPWVIAILGIVAAGLAVWFFKPTEPKRIVQLEYEIPEGQQLYRNSIGPLQYQLAISPDGSQFVYATTDGLYLRSMAKLKAKHITGTDKDSRQPFFSPDGQWIGYFSRSDHKLKKIGISGGAPSVLCDVGLDIAGASWDSDDTIVYSDILSGIMRISANGGTPEILIKGSLIDITKDGAPRRPQLLPDGDSLLFTNLISTDSGDEQQIVIHSLLTGKREVLFNGSAARYLPSGYIVFLLGNNDIVNLFAAPFDLDKLQVTGGSISVLEGFGSIAFSDSGTLVYVPQSVVSAGVTGVTSPGNTLVWVNKEGEEEPLGTKPDNYQTLKISPDGTKVAVSTIESGLNEDIWIWDILHQTLGKLTSDKSTDNTPVWSSDGENIAFFSSRNGSGDVYLKPANGIGQAELFISKPERQIDPWSFSRDGKFLVTHEIPYSPIGFDIGMVSMEGNREYKILLHESYFESQPQISPDGKYLAYQSDESGEENIYVRPFPNVLEDRWLVSRNGGNSPLWSPIGRELFYRSGDATVAVEIEPDPIFKYGNPKTLFAGTYFFRNIFGVTMTSWDIHPDGDKFLMIKPPATTASESPTEKQAAEAKQPKVIVVLNWFEELKEKVPVD